MPVPFEHRDRKGDCKASVVCDGAVGEYINKGEADEFKCSI